MNQPTLKHSATTFTGSGAFRYEADHNWARLPSEVRLGYTHGVAEAVDETIIIANPSRHASPGLIPTAILSGRGELNRPAVPTG